ncbi:MAG: glycosyltransferase [Coriobacteriia bacterium]|nr:glycosyltransferase [Coriobacteriia bacterium]
MKVLHTPLNLASDAWSLVKGLRAIGVDAHLATISENIFVNSGDIDLTFKDCNSLARQYKKWRFVRKEMAQYDVVHFHTGHSILDYGNGPFMLMDMKTAHRRGQTIAVTYHGCEVRNLQEGGCPWPCSAPVCLLNNRQGRFDEAMKYADLVYVTTPDLLPAVPGAMLLPQSVWGIEANPLIPPSNQLPMRIVHAPSRRSTKGTESIIETCNSLVSEGLDIDFRLVENATHEQALNEMSKADVVIDHVQIGWYCVVSVEAASYGKPVVVSFDDGYVKLSGMQRPPFSQATKATLGEVLRKLYAQRDDLADIGLKNREFVLKRHDAILNAQRVLSDYEKIAHLK